MRQLPAALLAGLLLAGCANAAPPPRPASTSASGTTASGTTTASLPAASAAAASAPFYLKPGVSVINGFTGQTKALIPAPDWAGPFWYPCGAAPDDRTFLLCGTDRYEEVRLGADGKPQWTSKPADIPVAARGTGSTGQPEFAVSPDARLAAVTTATGAIMVLSLVTGATRTWTIPPADGRAGDLSWGGDRYLAFQVGQQSGVRVLDTRSAATSALTASRLVIGNQRTSASGLSGVFNPVITPDGSKIVAAVWIGFIVAELAEFSAQTGRLLAVLVPRVHMPGSGSPCQVLWTDLSGAHLIAYCGTGVVVNGTRSTPVNLYVPNTSGTDFYEAVVW